MDKPLNKNITAALTRFGIVLPKSFTVPAVKGDLINDSRQIQSGDIFCAVIGHSLDGRKYIEQAINSGATLVVAECETANEHGNISFVTAAQSSSHAPMATILFYKLNEHLFHLAQAYYQNPQEKMTLIGLTGTNGKTSCSQLIAQLLGHFSYGSQPGVKTLCALVGTNGAGHINQLQPLTNTTPSATELNQLFYRFVDEKFTHTAMEVSSHALAQNRVSADVFDIAVFTNLSRDHLDYHGSMENYAAAKRKLFVANKKQIAVLNANDDQVTQWLTNWPNEQDIWLYGRNINTTSGNFFVGAKKIQHRTNGVTFTLSTHLGDISIQSPLLGDFNIDNLLAAIAVLLIDSSAESEAGLKRIADLVPQVVPIAGRMEAISAPGLPTAVVDYAHTPDALEQALLACQEHCLGKLYVVFGCGGDRDKGKRPLMAQAAEKYADHIIITNDNPRTESAAQIAQDILAGLSQHGQQQVKVLLEREQAVYQTLKQAKENDIVLLAGKGHEDYVILGKEKIEYNERVLVQNFYSQQTRDFGHSKGEINL